jgi:hypothetical protein
VGAPLLLCNRAAARLRLCVLNGSNGSNPAGGALDDCLAALALAPGHAKAEARREQAVLALRDGARDAATGQRDALVAALAERGVAVPDWALCNAQAALRAAPPPLPWGRSACDACESRGRDALTCRASLRHTAADFEVDRWRVGGRVRFLRSAAASAPGASLGVGLTGGAKAGVTEGTAYEAGQIASYDWRTGVHGVTREAGGGMLRVRLRAVTGLSYEPPALPALPQA